MSVFVVMFETTETFPSAAGIAPPASTLTFSFTFTMLWEDIFIYPLLKAPVA